jgi:hypothetical protein
MVACLHLISRMTDFLVLYSIFADDSKDKVIIYTGAAHSRSYEECLDNIGLSKNDYKGGVKDCIKLPRTLFRTHYVVYPGKNAAKYSPVAKELVSYRKSRESKKLSKKMSPRSRLRRLSLKKGR